MNWCIEQIHIAEPEFFSVSFSQKQQVSNSLHRKYVNYLYGASLSLNVHDEAHYSTSIRTRRRVKVAEKFK